ncbi:phosphotransferase enzyme domain protein [Scardovia inopinata]|uniref:Aminoglycoside phosphotransferase domain-containing protein n=1 Tax=Scardovia inopinata F0304 TaxID=641146 RepID=W5IHA0_SCAIO|nr:phosphotransferase [Scardovia inopinata]EFG26231.1 hypothetical protein HMPREF9020_01313 [Scardovia inopinata F0304]BAR07138.1 conserved hypothetical protein [Scardovia inopinata JCM 12537]SUV51209.1 phosphotransferase enzyme domain protein [Scardovia inopinata]
MSQRSSFEIAALASAAMPTLTVATTRRSEQFALSGDKDDIVTAIITDTTGEEYDVSISDSEEGKKRLKTRARAAYVLDNTHEPSALGFRLDHLETFVSGDDPEGSTGKTAVLIMPHVNGDAHPLSRLTETQCAAAGTCIGAVHRLRGKFIVNAHYPAYPSAQIHQQLLQWIVNLRAAGHIPTEILDNWDAIISNDNLWDFRSCPVHGGFSDGDILFTSTGISGIRHWEDMQINDPARDLAWIFTQLDPARRNFVLSAYARIMGNRMDDMIMLRAGLWVQMSQVGDFIKALERADSQKIMRFKSQVESLAHQISQLNSSSSHSSTPSTLTVGDLLNNSSSESMGRQQTNKKSDGQKPDGQQINNNQTTNNKADPQQAKQIKQTEQAKQAESWRERAKKSSSANLYSHDGNNNFDYDDDKTVVGHKALPPKHGQGRKPAYNRILQPPAAPNPSNSDPSHSQTPYQPVSWNSDPVQSEDFSFAAPDQSSDNQASSPQTADPHATSAADKEETITLPHVSPDQEPKSNTKLRDVNGYDSDLNDDTNDSGPIIAIDTNPDDIATETFASYQEDQNNSSEGEDRQEEKQ